MEFNIPPVFTASQNGIARFTTQEFEPETTIEVNTFVESSADEKETRDSHPHQNDSFQKIPTMDVSEGHQGNSIQI